MNDHLHALPAGHRLGEYRIEYVLGSGGFGITYYAWDTNLDKPVAVKEYLPNEFALRTDATTVRPKSASDEGDYQWGLERFLDEARTLARFKHPHLNEVHRFFEANGTAYIVLDYIEGETLSQLLKREGRLDETILGRLMEEMLSGLEEVHGAGFVHRDIKPGNIILRKDGSSVLLDFGAARQAVGQRSKSITSILTPGYAPIEQYDQKAEDVGPWSDLYALGMVAYRCISGLGEGGLPDAVTRARLERKGEQDKDLKPALEVGRGRYSESLLKAVDWAIKVDERERPQSVAEIRGVLGGREVAAGNVPAEMEAGAAADTEGGPAVQPGPVGSKSGNRKSSVLIFALLGGMSAAGIGVVGWIVGADINDGRTSLHSAAFHDDLKAAEYLVGRGADINAKNNYGSTPLHYAAWKDALKVAEYLVGRGADINATSDDGETPLQIAAWSDALKVAEYLVGRGADINAKTNDGGTPLHSAASNDALKVAEYLVGRGADINAKSKGGWTPLHSAAWKDALKVAEYLVGRGADINAKNNDGETPLHIVIRYDADEVAAWLRSKGAR